MKKPTIKTIAILMSMILFLAAAPVASYAQYQVPSVIRVGLYYKDSSVSTALSFFNVSAASGLQAGFYKDNTFTEIYHEPSGSTLFVRKDTYFYNAKGTLKEYVPATATGIDAAEKYGPYHIKIGADFPDQASAAAQTAVYQQMGVQAYIAYAEAWQVWTGMYVDESSLQAALVTIMPVLGDIGYSEIVPMAGSIVLVNDQYQPLCIFAGTSSYFQLRPSPENNPPVISIKGKPYRGALEVRRLAASDMTVINMVSIQEYLYGNVPAEIGGKSPAEAIKAQAVASKMYAINNAHKHGATGFDVCPTTHCQVYKGYSAEVAQCNAAIDQAKDYVISYNGKLAGSIFYYASGGGSTEDVRNVWGSSIPYLLSVPDNYEKIYNWTKTIRASDIKSKLPSLGNILSVAITKTSEAGRVTQLSIRGDAKTDPAVYTLERCRTLFSLDSQLYTIATDADVFTSSIAYVPTPAVISTSQPGAEAIQQATAVTTPQAAAEQSAEPQDAVTQASGSTPAAVYSPLALPVLNTPTKTLLGGKKVATADGIKTVGGTGNKVTILGAGGALKTATLIPETYIFTGKGWGHSVGMSQEGAIGMGKAGIPFDQILQYYFPGTKVEPG